MIDIALASGFWNRLIGLLAHPASSTVERVQALALSYPTSVSLSTADAETLLNMGLQAIEAGRRFAQGFPAGETGAPRVNLPPAPALANVPDARFQAAVLLSAESIVGQDLPGFFQIGHLQTWSDLLKHIDDFMQAYRGQYSRYEEFLHRTYQDLLEGKTPEALPLWVVSTDLY